MVSTASLFSLVLIAACLVFLTDHVAASAANQENSVHESAVRQDTQEGTEVLGSAECDACTACANGLTCTGAGLCVPSGDGADAAYRKCVDDGSVAHKEIAGRKLCDPCTRCKSYDLTCFAGICVDKLAATETYLECVAAGSTPVGGVLPQEDSRITEERPQTSPLYGEKVCDQCDMCRVEGRACWGAGLCVPLGEDDISRRMYRWCLKKGYQPLRKIVGTEKCEPCTTCSTDGMMCFAGICVDKDSAVPEYKQCIANGAKPVGGKLPSDSPRLNRYIGDGKLAIGRKECDKCTTCRPGDKLWCWGKGICVSREDPVQSYEACLSKDGASSDTCKN